MDEITLIRELAPEVPLRQPEQLSAARARLFDAIGHPAAPRPRRTGRLVIAGLATTSVAAALAAVVVLAPNLVGGDVTPANAEPAQILHRAAEVALTAPDLQPRPDQFLYQDNGGDGERWLSVDGTRDGLAQRPTGRDVLPGCRDGQRATLKKDQTIGTEPCTPDPAYLPDLPADADAMLQYLQRGYTGEPGDTNAIGKNILFLIKDHYLRPQARAALFDAAAAMPGLSVVEHTTDGSGRPGIGIAWSAPGPTGQAEHTSMIIFDEQTYEYLGFRHGDHASAEVQVAIVDEVGQRP